MADERLIPEGIRDTSTIAFNELFDRMGTIDLTPLLVYLTDNVASSALIHLADQFHVMGNEGWNISTTDFEKRKIVKEAINNHKYKGTKSGVKRALESLGFIVELTEWFEYGGRAFNFKLKLSSTSQTYQDNMNEKINNYVDEYKNVRSVLENLELNLPGTSEIPVLGIGSAYSLYITGGIYG